MERGPFSYADPALIERDLIAAGFTHMKLETIALTSRVKGAPTRRRADGTALRLTSPLGNRSGATLCDPRGADAVTAALERWDGIDAPMSAHVITRRNDSADAPRRLSRS